MQVTTQVPQLPTGGFLTEDFLLENETARVLYHTYAAPQPIVDYHCHLSPQYIAQNHRFENLTEIWLRGDHYKWRAMRANGVDESLITGAGSDWAKFEAYAATLPYALRNPLYHWTHLELQRPFGWHGLLTPASARAVYDHCTALLQTEPFRAQGLLRQFDVRVVCTTDDPTDDLAHHQALRQQPFGTRVLPTFRPDKALLVADVPAFNQWLDALEQVTGAPIANWEALLEALAQRMAFFHAQGCRLSDHGLNYLPAVAPNEAAARAHFTRLRAGDSLTATEAAEYCAALLHFLCAQYAAKGWAQQFHLGALRNTNRRLFAALGADTGADSLGDWPQAEGLVLLFDGLETQGALAKTIVYNLNPADNALFATLVGNYQGGGVPGKLQYGASWWFLDQKQGIEDQLNALSNFGLLGRFVGMLTDSRSFLSYSRHEYFRRILCNLLGRDVVKGELPNDLPYLGGIVEKICYQNAVDYFDFPA